MATQHASLTAERWATFARDQQILMIANELQRAGKLGAATDAQRRRNSYARVLQLLDLTIQVQQRHSLRRELLRLRDVVAELYLAGRSEPEDHRAATRCLLRLSPTASRQLPP